MKEMKHTFHADMQRPTYVFLALLARVGHNCDDDHRRSDGTEPVGRRTDSSCIKLAGQVLPHGPGWIKYAADRRTERLLLKIYPLYNIRNVTVALGTIK